MKILVVAATQLEIFPFLSEKKFKHIEVLIAGVGQVLTTFNLVRKITMSKYTYDFILNVGLAGSFDFSLGLGEVYQVTSDCFADFGVQDKDLFIPIHKTEFFVDNIINEKGLITNDFVLNNFPIASAITTNIVHGEKNSIEKVKKMFPYQLESMEGAAFLYVCKALGIKCLQLRSVSNYITERNKADWKINLAVRNLNKKLVDIVNTITS